MKTNFHIAVIGATGAVGREVIRILEERKIEPKSLRFAASRNSAGGNISFRGDSITIEELTDSFFKNIDVAICSAGSAVSKKFIHPDVSKNTVVIDNCSFHRMDPQIPLVIPEINAHQLDQRPSKSIIANPNCTTIAMLVPLGAIHRKLPMEKIICSSYQSVSGAGQKGIEELKSQVQPGSTSIPNIFPKKIAFNLIPNIGGLQSDGNSVEEQKMIDETRKILGNDSIQVAATCVRVPTFIGHGLSLYVETKNPLELSEVKKILKNAPGVTVMDDESYPVLEDCKGKDDVYVGRIRHGMTPNSFQLWVVSDNLRKGAALNAVQILETVSSKNWL